MSQTLRLVLLALGWISLAFVVYKLHGIQERTNDPIRFDPYHILGVEIGATGVEIKRAYHRLSLVYHPDKPTGNATVFVNIVKAYTTLTNDNARTNYEEYGNPDGPVSTQFGIALPQWLLQNENQPWVLGIYAVVFLVVLPITIGLWWWNA